MGSGEASNEPPQVYMEVYAETWPPQAGRTISFYANAWDPDGWVVNYAWDFGDGTTAQGDNHYYVSHTYAEPGDYTVTVTVTDNEGATATDSHFLPVEAYEHQPPVVWIEGPHAGRAGTPLHFWAWVNSDAPVTSYTWDMGDGSPPTHGSAVEHTYAAPGTYTITLDVTDEHGATGSDTHEVAVQEASIVDVAVQPLDIALALARSPSIVTDARYQAVPPTGTPNGVARGPLSEFPTSGDSFAVLTTGNATLADMPNISDSSGEALGGGNVRGNSDYDVTILEIDLDVPAGANCLTLDFKFLSEEYPQWVGSSFNDAFIAELNQSTWTTQGSEIIAPDNFAFDQAGNVVSINATGVAEMTPEEAFGTTYDGATPLLRAATPVEPGPNTLFLSIFDQGDMILDSAVFIDNLAARHVLGACEAGLITVDDLEVAVTMSQPSYGLTEQAHGLLTVTGSNSGQPIADAHLLIEVEYASGDEFVDGLLAETDCATWTTATASNEDGIATFDVPQAIAARCLAGLPGVMDLPTDLLEGTYSVRVTATHLIGDGLAATAYAVELL